MNYFYRENFPIYGTCIDHLGRCGNVVDWLFLCAPCRVRELTTAKVGTLLRISGQVVRTHPVHPELVSGAFICLECQTAVPDVEQQFKFTQVCVTPPQVFLFTSYTCGASSHSFPSSFLIFHTFPCSPSLLLHFTPPSYPPQCPLRITSSFHSILSTSLILFPSPPPPPPPIT